MCEAQTKLILFFLVPTILQEKHCLIHNKSQTTAMPHLGPDNDNETANTHSLTNLDGSSIQEQSNQPKKDSVQDDNENEPQKKSFCASSIINHTDKELPKVDNTTPPDDEPTHIHHIKHPQYKIIAENKSKGNGVYVGMIPEEDQYISDNGKHVKTPDLKPKVITPTPEQLKRCEQNRLRALQKQKDNKAKADTAKRCLLPELNKESPKKRVENPYLKKKRVENPYLKKKKKIMHKTIKQLPMDYEKKVGINYQVHLCNTYTLYESCPCHAAYYYQSWCPLCHQTIHHGDCIIKEDDGVGWHHTECPFMFEEDSRHDDKASKNVSKQPEGTNRNKEQGSTEEKGDTETNTV